VLVVGALTVGVGAAVGIVLQSQGIGSRTPPPIVGSSNLSGVH
jgi:hypothetical protein